mmetsp:Transcript_9768/g.18621  ORF Transcript_9768/g.18621 Transcript_9768/m.18621 type:complete len:711 (-) Transcript_9768:319-2451(-)
MDDDKDSEIGKLIFVQDESSPTLRAMHSAKAKKNSLNGMGSAIPVRRFSLPSPRSLLMSSPKSTSRASRESLGNDDELVIIETESNLNSALSSQISKLLRATSGGNLREVQKMMKADERYRRETNFKGTRLVNRTDYDNRSALHVACSGGHFNIVALLIESLADPNIRDRWGRTPLTDASEAGSAEIIEYLREHGAAESLGDLSSKRDYSGLLCRAGAEADISTLKRMVELKVDINTQDYNKRTALHLAANHQHASTVAFILQVLHSAHSQPQDEAKETKDQPKAPDSSVGSGSSDGGKEHNHNEGTEDGVEALGTVAKGKGKGKDQGQQGQGGTAGGAGGAAAAAPGVNALDMWNKTPLQMAIDTFGPECESAKLLIQAKGLVWVDSQLVPHTQLATDNQSNPTWRILASELTPCHKVLGRGAFGAVELFTWHGIKVAVKLDSLAKPSATPVPALPSSQGQGQPPATAAKSDASEFRTEIEVLQRLRHPHIVQFFGVVEENNKPLRLVYEYMPNRTLQEFRAKHIGKQIPLRVVIKLGLHIAAGLCYLHSQSMIHRDVKPSNLLLDQNNNIKVADFGLVKRKALNNRMDQYKMTGETGSYRYMAPEVFRHECYGEKVDVYSFGVIMYELLENKGYMQHLRAVDVAWAVENGQRPMFHRRLPPPLLPLVDTIQQCWADSAEERPNFSTVISKLYQLQETLLASKCSCSVS